MPAKIDKLLQHCVEKGASDIHLSQGNPPLMRLHGHLEPVLGVIPVTNYDELLYEILEPHQKEKFIKCNDLDFAYPLENICRFRGNYYRQINGVGAAFRQIPHKIRTLPEMNMPASVEKILKFRRGLVLVTGPTGSGKSTTLAAIIDGFNRSLCGHIITIEDPLEFVHPNQKCLVTHREVGQHATTFSDALKAAMRENPDVILVGEMRDIETIGMALNASETGVLVFGTLHTQSAAKTIDRLVDAFPESEQDTVRGLLAENLKAVVSQQLLRTVNGKGRVAAVELMFGNHAVSNLIREGKTPMISSTIQSSASEGMVGMEKSLADLVNAQKIKYEDAYSKAMDKEYFQKLCKAPAAA